jgi:hypothetical protein
VLYQLSYGPLALPSALALGVHHGQGRNRTADTTIFSRVLYQLSYLASTYKKAARTLRRGRGM